MAPRDLDPSMCDVPEEEMAEYLAWHEPVRVPAPRVRARRVDAAPTEADRPSPVDAPVVATG